MPEVERISAASKAVSAESIERRIYLIRGQK